MNPLRAWIRRAIPLKSRQAVAQVFRELRDLRNGMRLSVARGDAAPVGYTVHAEITQPIMPGLMFENKLSNLTHGARLVNLSLVAPGQTWSFWRHVRKPSEANGFAVGRNQVDGRLTPQVGGGLCQLSSLMYHLGLLAGLDITERHAHSIDIYHATVNKLQHTRTLYRQKQGMGLSGSGTGQP